MNRRYTLPVAIALLLHVGLFLGSGKPPVVTVAAAKPVKGPVEEPPVVKLDDEPPPSDEPEKPFDVKQPPKVPEPPIGWKTSETTIVEYARPEARPPTSDKPIVKLGTPGGDTKAPLTIDQLDETPNPRFQKAPIYPTAMRRDKVAARVVVDFWVDENGRVHDVRVVNSSDRHFDEPTISAVSVWRFEPGKRRGIPVRFRMSLPVVFNVEGE